MPPTAPNALRARLLAVVVALALPLTFLAPLPASAATWSLKASGGGSTTAAEGKKLTVRYLKNGDAVRGAAVRLQRKKNGSWSTIRTVRTGSQGRVSTRVHPSSTRKFRFRTGRTTSASLTVRILPARFAITGSGSGHGVGLAQWGAYEKSRNGRSAAEILDYYYPGTRLSTANDPRTTLDVQVLGPPADSRRRTDLSIGSGRWRLLAGNGAVMATGAASRQVRIEVTSTGLKATVRQDGERVGSVVKRSSLAFEWSGTRDYRPSATKAVAHVAGAQGTYRNGRLVLTNLSGRPNVVNQVVINTEYLYGLDEMPSGWASSKNGGTAALQAQAIVARNYAIRAKVAGHRPACGCHVYDDTRSQNYTGWKKEGGPWGGAWSAAVDATVQDGTVSVLRDGGGGFAETPYFASSGSAGGRRGTGANADVFGTTPLPYLVHVPDPASARAPGNPYVSWTDSISQDRAGDIFGVGWVRTVSVTSRWSSGQVRTLQATSAGGKKVSRTKTAEGWRTALGLRGSWVRAIDGRTR
ncbi:SpoIID/LytB domain-containing protein [Isoptericola aurantiacus]|uniref:SpoIID/LytB domain-containing protein n=1 Tax=Isoptericola aurantiacus TaxID=3377839 RepID=UPI00383B3AC7